MPSLSDAGHRQRALTDHSATLLVQAGAGTGKTSLLAGRVALLLASGIHPCNVAAITFTELAASELLQRIQEYVHDLINGKIPEPLKTALSLGLTANQLCHLSRAAEALDELTCATIHGFCQRMITPYPIEADLDPGASLMNEGEADLNHRMLLRRWLRKCLGEPQGDDPLAELLVIDADQGLGLVEQVAEARRARRTASGPAAELSQVHFEQFRKTVSSFRDWYEKVRSLGLEQPTTADNISEFEKLAAFYAQTYRSDTPFRQIWAYSHPPQIPAMKENSFEFRQYKCKGKWKDAAKNAGKSREEGVPFNFEACVLYDGVAKSLRLLVGLAAEAVQARLICALDDFQVSFGEFKRRSALLDFDDLLYFARGLLRTNAAVRTALAERYRYVLVDEFQDTDPLQCEILFLLCGEGVSDQPWHEQRLRPGQLFLVGDPKQSVYRFRRADMECYKRAKLAIERQFPGNILAVTDNFRSRQSILDFVNQRFAEPLSSIGYKSLVCTVSSPECTESSLARIPVGREGSEYTVHDWRKLEAEAVAASCRQLIGQFIVRENNSLVACRPGDIALLAPTGTDLWIYERALEDQDIPIATQAGKSFFIRQEVHDLVAIARILSNSRDTLALGALLRGPLVGLTERDLLDIVGGLPRCDGKFQTLRLRTDAAQIKHQLAADVVKVLQELSRTAYQTSPFDIMSAAVEKLHVRAILFQRHPRYVERALANVERFLEMAKPYAVRGLRVFADDMTRLWKDGEREVEGRADASHDAVHIVSIHSAKGLEWPVVIPINLVTNVRSASGVLHRATDDTLHCGVGTMNPPGYAAVKELEDCELGEERIRLLYVACTRARDLLAFPHYMGLSGRCWHRQVDLQLDSLPEIATHHVKPRHTAKEMPHNGQTAEIFRQESLNLFARTRKVDWIQPSRVEVDEPFAPAPVDEDLVMPTVEVSGSAFRGRTLHKLMEEILLGETEDDETSLQIRAAELLRQLGENDCSDPSEGASSQEIASTISRTLRLSVMTQYRSRLQPELSVFQLRDDGTGTAAAMTGIVDALAIGKDGTPELVIDWKSDVAPTPETRQHHRSQVQEYLECTGARRGLIVYITTGEVQPVSQKGLAARVPVA